MASSTSSAEKELSLLGKVELRIALADTDRKLEDLLKTYLSPILLKLTSEHSSVREKVRNFKYSLVSSPGYTLPFCPRWESRKAAD